MSLFRRAGVHRADFSSSEALRDTLQRRLRLLAWISAAFNIFAPLGVLVTSTSHVTLRSSLFYALVTAVFVMVAVLLRPARTISLSLLRWIEAGMFSAAAVMLVGLNIYDYTTLTGVYRAAPIDIALGQAALWVFQMVAYGVLIPNSGRRTAIAMILFVVAALAPDVWATTTNEVPHTLVPTIFGFKVVVLTLIGTMLWFGSYRYEVVARREAEARELGQYALGAQLGAGGMGEVYRGEHRMLRRPVAIKLINAAQAGSTEALARFEREAQATAQLTHPNTVQIFDYGRADDGTFYCVMELLDGETLDAIVARDGPMSASRAIHVLRQLCGAIAEAHSRGLVHRDIKPSNVILGTRGGVPDVAKLLDFGLVTSRGTNHTDDGMATLTQAGVIVGTPEFMSPEQCGDPATIGAASDLYSLGALGYFLVAGRSPFAGRSPVQMLAAHLYEKAQAPSLHVTDVPEELDAILLRALEKDPASRFTSAREMDAALATVAFTPPGSSRI